MIVWIKQSTKERLIQKKKPHLPTPPLGQHMTHGQFFRWVYQVWIQSFPSPRLVASQPQSYWYLSWKTVLSILVFWGSIRWLLLDNFMEAGFEKCYAVMCPAGLQGVVRSHQVHQLRPGTDVGCRTLFNFPDITNSQAEPHFNATRWVQGEL